MSSPTKEYQPLLPSSEDESHVCTGTWRPYSMTGEKNRAVLKMRGASYVMHLWPDQLSSTLYNCWVALFVMVFMFTAMFGVLMSFSTLPNNQLRFGRELAKAEAEQPHLHQGTPKTTTVYCPIIKDNNFNLSKYVTSFAYLRKRFPMYKYNVIVLVNNINETTAQDHNIVALNTVFNRGRDKNRSNLAKEMEHLVSSTNNLAIKVQLLANFMNDSPLKNNWKQLSKTLMPLLIQSVAIWQTGGIAFNLNALVEKKSSRLNKYIQKVLRDFPNEEQTIYPHGNLNLKSKELNVSRKPVNNIRDVINNINNNYSPPVMQANLKAEESKVDVIARKTKRSISVADSSKILIDKEKERHQLPKSNDTHASASNKSKIDDNHKTQIKKHKSFLPNFLKIMYNANDVNAKKMNLNTTTTKKIDNKVLPKNTATIPLTQKHETVPSKDINSNKQNINIKTFTVRNITSKNVNLKDNVNKRKIMNKFFQNSPSVHNVQKIEKNELSKVKSSHETSLILDMKGELIATKTSCHAFIGHIFSTAQKYPTNSITKLINKTLKTFCVLPSNCVGIRLLL